MLCWEEMSWIPRPIESKVQKYGIMNLEITRCWLETHLCCHEAAKLEYKESKPRDWKLAKSPKTHAWQLNKDIMSTGRGLRSKDLNFCYVKK